MVRCTPNPLTLQLQGCDTQSDHIRVKEASVLFRRRHRSGEFGEDLTLAEVATTHGWTQ